MERWTPEVVRYLLDTTVDGIVAADASGRVTHANPSLGRILGCDIADVLDQPLDAVLTSADDPSALARALSGAATQRARLQLRRGDGSPVPVLLDTDRVGSLQVVVLHDQTETVETQAALAEVEQQMGQLQQLGHVGLWRWAPTTDELQWSHELYQIHGIDPLAFEGSLAGHLARVREDHRDAVHRAFLGAASEGARIEIEYTIVLPDGDERILYCKGDPVFDPRGQVRAVSGILQDVTSDREARRTIEVANDRLERFASALAHDLREPVTAITGYADVLTDVVTIEGQAATFVERIRVNATNALALVNDLLEQARNRTPHEDGEVALDDVLTWVLDALADRIEHVGATVTSSPMPTVKGIESLLRQALLNLVGNAVKYGGHDGSGPRIHVSVGEVDGAVELRVDDDGPGVPPDERDAIFADGRRLSRDVDRGIEGTGIGLATVREIAAHHETTVHVTDSPLGGARFAIALQPAAPAGTSQAEGPPHG